MTVQQSIRPDEGRKPSIEDIPGEDGLPIFGQSFELLRDPVALTRRMRARYGKVYRGNAFFGRQVVLLGPEGNEFFFMDRQRILSSKRGWNPILRHLFPRGLMLRDFDDHKAHRKIMGVAFKTPAMRHYMEVLNEGIPARLAQWSQRGEFRFYDAIKDLTLEMAARVFLGLEPGAEAAKVNRALTDMVSASIALLRFRLPGLLYNRGIKGRQYMVDYLAREIPHRRGADGSDMLTLLCNATDEDGNAFTDDEIIDHMNFLWMAAHDTITSSVTTLVYELGRHPEWQDRLRDEVLALGLNDGGLPYDRMGDMKLTEAAFKEALRMRPPVPSMPRETLQEVTFGGHVIPAGTMISISVNDTHMDPEIWPEPDRFDPLRFTEEGGVRERHKFAWVPFGGGAHMCIGLHFAYMQMKVIMAHLLRDYRIKLRDGYTTEYQVMPLTKPKDGLPVRILPR